MSQGFIPVSFWESMECARSETALAFFLDSNLDKVEKKFKSFCEKMEQSPSVDYSALPTQFSIPPIIHFIWLGSPVPPKVTQIIQTWQECHPGWDIKVWQEEQIKHFKWFTEHSKKAFEQATTWSEKADIWRYEILYQCGGIYADTDFICLKPFHDLITYDVTFFACLETNQLRQMEGHPFCVGNSLMGAQKGHPVFRFCLDELKTQEEAPLETLLYRTGPLLFARACIKYLEQDNLLILPCSYFYPLPFFEDFTHKNYPLEDIFKYYVKPESMALHLWEASWQQPLSKQ